LPMNRASAGEKGNSGRSGDICPECPENIFRHFRHIASIFRDLFPVHFSRKRSRKTGTMCRKCRRAKANTWGYLAGKPARDRSLHRVWLVLAFWGSERYRNGLSYSGTGR
jgi:hypothetical protein